MVVAARNLDGRYSGGRAWSVIAVSASVLLAAAGESRAADEEFRTLTSEKPAGGVEIAYSPDSQFLASAGGKHSNPKRLSDSRNNRGWVTIWDVASGEVIARTDDFPIWCGSLDFSPDGTMLAVGCGDRSVHGFRQEQRGRVWRRVARFGRPRHPLDRLVMADQVQFSPDSRWLACSSYVHLYFPRNSQLAPRHHSLGIQIWRTEDLTLHDTIQVGSGNVHGLWFLDAEARRLLIARSLYFFDAGGQKRMEAPLVVVDVEQDAVSRELPVQAILGEESVSASIDVSTDFSQIALGEKGALAVIDAETFEVQRRFDVPGEPVGNNVSLSPDGKLLASCGLDTVHLWDVESGALICSREHRLARNIVFSPDGAQFATTSNIEKGVRVWDVKQLMDQ